MRTLARVASLIVALTGSAAAQPSPAHERAGLFLRAVVALDQSRTTANDQYIGFGEVGWGPGLTLALGVTVAGRWAIYGEAFDHQVSHVVDFVDTPGVFDLDLRGGGAGVQYYWPRDAHLGLALGYATATSHGNGFSDGDLRVTGGGPRVAIDVGQDWWLSDHRSLGLQVQLSYGAAAIGVLRGPNDARVSQLSVGVVATLD